MTSQKVGDRRFSRTDSARETNNEHNRTVSLTSLAPAPPRRSENSSADNLASLATAARWGTTTVGLLWAVALRSKYSYLALGVVLVAYALWRTYLPLQYRRRGWKSLVSILVELATATAVTVATGCWDSPYIFALFTPVIAAGFARGFWHALRIGVTAAVTVGLAATLLHQDSGIHPITAWCGELMMVASVASYGSRLLRRAEEADERSRTQLWRLNEANSLLMSLNRLAHDISDSFDLQESTAGAMNRVREIARPDCMALLLLEPLNSVWNVVMAEGVRLPESFADDQLPVDLVAIARREEPEIIDQLKPQLPGLKPSSRSALYVPLWIGVRQIGLLAVESDQRNHFHPLHRSLLGELAPSLALAIDNARWFDRLRARGAAQERTRIARDLHDRVGQGVAYLAFELDRISQQSETSSVDSDIERLRDDARSIVSELRETLYDLRSDVTEERGFEAVAREYLHRVGKRSNLEVHFESQTLHRLTLMQEREIWRIFQEAVTNVERHAGATTLEVAWTVDGHGGARLAIADDGQGLDSPDKNTDTSIMPVSPTSNPRPSYGITGMRERAEGINAVLEIGPRNGGTGTLVRLTLKANAWIPQR
jgi:signal transduction histidine kinase